LALNDDEIVDQRLSLSSIGGREFGFMKKVLQTFWNDEDGQTTTEYIILLAIVIAIVFRFRSTLEEKLTSLIDKIFSRTDDIIK